MNVKLIRYTAEPDELAGLAAAKCTKSDKPMLALRHAVYSGHESVIEHASFTFEVDGVSRVLLAQLTRHRMASYSVQSQRYCGAPDPVQFTVRPPSFAEHNYVGSVDAAMTTLAELYLAMVADGVPEEDARYILPEGLMTSLILTMNTRELRHFFSLRCCNRAQWEIRQLADEMLKQCKKVAPVLFTEAGPDCVSDRCHEKRPCGHPRHREEWDA